MNGRTREFISEAVMNLTCAQVNDWSDLTEEEKEQLNRIEAELLNLMTPPRYTVTLEGWYWNTDERVFAHLDDLHSFPSEQAAIDEQEELVNEQEKLLLAATNGTFCDGTALTVYERKGSESRVVQMYILQHGRKPEFYWGDDAEHTAL